MIKEHTGITLRQFSEVGCIGDQMVNILVGEAHQVALKKQQLVGDFLKDNDRLALEQLDADSIELTDLCMSLSSLPLLNPNKMVTVGSLLNRPDLHKDITTILGSVAPGVSLVLSEPELPARSAYHTLLTKQAGYTIYQPRQAAALKKWLAEYAKTQGANLEPAAADLLLDFIGDNNLSLATEITKLSLHEAIDRQLVVDLVEPTPRSKIFDLLDAMVQGNQHRALELYEDQRSQKAEPLGILAMIIWQVQLLLLASRIKDSPQLVATKAGLSPFPLTKASRIIKSMSQASLQALIDLCIDTERRIRSDFTNPDTAIKFLISKGCPQLRGSTYS